MPIIRSVSQANFELSGDRSFEDAVAATVQWMRRKNDAIPADSEGGAAFDVGGGGDHPAQAVNLAFEGGRVWAATLDDPDKAVIGRTWVTEITIGEQASRVHFGSRLVSVTRRADEPYVASLPGIVPKIISSITCLADGVDLSEQATRVDTPAQVDDFVSVVDDPARRLPVLAIADPREGRDPFAPLTPLARRLSGAAHVYSLSDQACWDLTRLFGKPLSVFGGAARLYRPGFQSDRSNPFDHPLWIARIGSSPESRSGMLVSQVLAAGVNAGPKGEYPRFNEIRQAVAAGEIRAQRSTSSDADLLRLYEDENQRLDRELKDVRSEFDQWLADADAERRLSESVAAELKADLAKLRMQNDALRLAVSNAQGTQAWEPLRGYEGFEEWAATNLSGNVWIAPKAIKEMEKNGVFEDPELIGNALRALDEIYVPMRRGVESIKKTDYDLRLQSLNISDQPCFGERNTIKRFPEYAVTYQGERFWCDQHLKHAGGTDPRRAFRVYYHWHEDDQIVLIGHLPTHLDNKLTN